MESIYREEIFNLAKNATDEIFYNSSSEHAAIVHQAIMKYAKKYVYIFCSSLCTEISNNDNYCSAVDSFLASDKQHNIHIILTDYNKDFCNKSLAKVLGKYPQQVELKSFRGKIVLNEKDIHFTISDDKAFRIETDIKQHMAYGNFNSPKKVTILKDIFNKTFDSPITKSIFC